MKEVVVMLSLMCSGVLAAQGIPHVVEQLCVLEFNRDGRFVGFDVDKPITQNELQRYSKVYETPALSAAVDRFYHIRYRAHHSERQYELNHLLLSPLTPSHLH